MGQVRGGTPVPLSRQIKEHRKSAGLTQHQLANLAGVSIGAIRDLEQGRVMQPHPEPARRIAAALNMNPAQWDPAGADKAGPGRGLWIGVLGALAVARDGMKAGALPAGQRAVLGLLALAHGAPVHPDSIVDALWQDGPPATAAGIVQTYVSRLRRVLDLGDRDDRDRLLRDGSGYRLQVVEDELDLLTFRRLVADAGTARQAGDAEQACTAYERALSMWRGEPLADIDVLQGHPAIIALVNERAAAVLDHADIAAASGWHERALPQLWALASRSPLDEAAQSRLVIALAGAGRQAEALEAYEKVRRRLDEELGMLPGPALRDAHIKVLRQQVRLPAGPSASHDPWLPLFQLPAAPADFTGRAPESARLVAAITPRPGQSGVPLAVVSGPPGAGKTALALHVAHTVHAEFPEGQLWVHLAGASTRPRDTSDVLGEFLRALGVHGSAIPQTLSERAALYRSRLAGRRILVVADDAATAGQVRPLMPGTPGCALLVTSRSRMADLDGAQLAPLDTMTPADALAMLTRIVGEDRVIAEHDAAKCLIEACGAMPLAVRIAGAKLAARPLWSLSMLSRRITGAHARLPELESGDLSMRASIASSYESLPERPRRAFRLLSLLGPSDFAEWVAGALLGAPDGGDVIGELANRSLLTPLSADRTGEPRYRLHDLLRDYAAERLEREPAAEANQALEWLLTSWLQLAWLADLRLPPEPFFPAPSQGPPPAVLPEQIADRLIADPIAWFTSERINLLAATGQACEIGLAGLARQLASHQCAYQYLHSRYDDSERIWRTIADSASRAGDRAGAVHARLRVGASTVGRGLAVDTLPSFAWCVETARQLEDAEILAYALYWRGVGSAWELDDYEQAHDDAEAGIRVARSAGLRHAESMHLRLMTIAHAMCGAGDDAVAAGQQALAIAVDLRVASYELAALHDLAFACTRAGQHARAVSVCRRRIEISRELGDVRAEAEAHGVLGDAHYGLGDYATAVTHYLRALPVFRDLCAGRHHALCLEKLGRAYEAMGRYPEAIHYLKESLTDFCQLHLPDKVEQVQDALDRCHKTSGRGEGTQVLPSLAAQNRRVPPRAEK
jgi:DNA-binding SARP family transcriptional activator/DNA-binding XRE family transcriptional regulator